MTSALPPHGGYKKLKSYQTAELVYDLTVAYCSRYIKSFKLREQVEGAARSGVQNIGEGSKFSATSKPTELHLTNAARSSHEELQLDMKAFLRQHELEIWDKDDARTTAIRQLAYQKNRTNGTNQTNRTNQTYQSNASDSSDTSYLSYKSYLDDPEQAANCILTLSYQATYLLDQQIKRLEQDLLTQGDIPERLRQARKNEQKRQLFDDGPPFEDFLAEFGLKRLPNGQVIKKDTDDKKGA